MKKDITLESTYNGLPINTNKEKEEACFINILDKIYAHTKDMTNTHCKVLQVRFDLHYPQDNSIEPKTEHLDDFSYNLQRKLNREKIKGGHKVDPRLITVTEQHHSKHPHVHAVLLVNANAKKNYYPLLQEVDKQWQQALNTKVEGLVHFCDKQGKNGMIMDKNKENFHEKVELCFHHASYLAKIRGKENKIKGTWVVRGTRVPK